MCNNKSTELFIELSFKDKCIEEAVILKFLLYKLTITLIGETALIKQSVN